jgi:hypothetical protein
MPTAPAPAVQASPAADATVPTFGMLDALAARLQQAMVAAAAPSVLWLVPRVYARSACAHAGGAPAAAPVAAALARGGGPLACLTVGQRARLQASMRSVAAPAGTPVSAALNGAGDALAVVTAGHVTCAVATGGTARTLASGSLLGSVPGSAATCRIEDASAQVDATLLVIQHADIHACLGALEAFQHQVCLLT